MSAELAARAGDGPEGDPHAAGRGGGEHDVAGFGGGGGPLGGRSVPGVGGQDGEVGVHVHPDEGGLHLAAASAGERELGRAVPQVVGTGHDLARGQDEAGASAVAADGDEGGGDAGGDRPGGHDQI